MTFLNKTVLPKSLALFITVVYCLIAVLALSLSNARGAEANQSTPLNIWAVGDSRVEGFRPVFESYRYELWKRLIDASVSVDFIGENRDIGSYPSYRGKAFDRDHDGYGGATSADIVNGIDEVLGSIAAPDILLLGIGGNDLLDAAAPIDNIIANIRRIVASTRVRNSRVTVFIEQIAPPRSDALTPSLRTQAVNMNRRIRDLAAALSTPSSKVVSVDMYSGWSDSYMADEVHYNEQGAAVVAQRYFQAIKKLLEQTTVAEPNPNNGETMPVPDTSLRPSLASIIALLLN